MTVTIHLEINVMQISCSMISKHFKAILGHKIPIFKKSCNFFVNFNKF